jgi:hypothetical protein
MAVAHTIQAASPAMSMSFSDLWSPGLAYIISMSNRPKYPGRLMLMVLYHLGFKSTPLNYGSGCYSPFIKSLTAYGGGLGGFVSD